MSIFPKLLQNGTKDEVDKLPKNFRPLDFQFFNVWIFQQTRKIKIIVLTDTLLNSNSLIRLYQIDIISSNALLSIFSKKLEIGTNAALPHPTKFPVDIERFKISDLDQFNFRFHICLVNFVLYSFFRFYRLWDYSDSSLHSIYPFHLCKIHVLHLNSLQKPEKFFQFPSIHQENALLSRFSQLLEIETNDAVAELLKISRPSKKKIVATSHKISSKPWTFPKFWS